MIPRDLTPANAIVRATFTEVVATRWLKAAVTPAPPESGDALLAGIIADLKSGVGEYIAVAKSGRDPKLHRGAEALQGALDAMVKEVESLKPKA